MTLSRKEIAVLGMMIFSLFLGAGNIIFPPMEGFQAGTNWLWAALGFILTGVIMPFITLLTVSVKGRGEELSHDLPQWLEVAFWSILYLVIGSTFAMPRITNVAYEMAWQPLNLFNGDYSHIVFAIAFNLIALLFMLGRSTMISSIGKFMAPLLLLLLAAVGFAVMTNPLSEIIPPSHAYADNSAVATGLVSGYQTMDVLSAMAFGGIVARALAVKGVAHKSAVLKYALSAGVVSVVLLAALYLCLFYLGATSAPVAQNASNGGQIFSAYVNQLFGKSGLLMMSAIVLLASLTTLVGVTSACADYFSQFHHRLNYKFFVILFSVATTVIAETGLTTLLRVTIPALLLIYPMAIILVVLQFLRPHLPNVRFSYRLTIAVVLLFSLCDSLNNLGWLPPQIDRLLNYVPFYHLGLSWAVPALIALGLSVVLGKSKA
ncbi:branched-chain amino acid transport system II carrier protein [Pasteurella testudinis]|uniref:branched-chain amino acid transport system II carrier protein n=1 Tax=Pasteurella testudinis TaxID=761 RepID=UPI00405985DE